MITRIAVIALLLFLLVHPADLNSCGPFFPSAVFTNPTAPDDERAFFAGNLGILQPTYERRYLAMAYRILNNEPLSKLQIDSIVDLNRLRTPDIDDQVRAWLTARHTVPDAQPVSNIDVYRQTDYFIQVPICGADAFVTAKNTLAGYVQQFGSKSGQTKQWLAAQDAVFLNCGPGAGMPDPAPPGSNERIIADREYQIAAAYFYSKEYDKARAEWRKIASDPKSPWRVWAPYLIARSYLREANYTEAAAQLKLILADPQERSLYRQARDLLDFAQVHINPGAQLVELSNRLMRPQEPDLAHDLNDYTFLFDRLQKGSAGDYQPGMTQEQMMAITKSRYDALENAVSQSDLSAWISQFQGGFHKNIDPLDRWHKTKSLAWLFAAPPTPETLEALRNVPDSSPGYATARSLLARMLTAANKQVEAAQVLDETFAASASAGLNTSTLNEFYAERMKVASTFEDFLKYAPRKVVSIDNPFDEFSVQSAPKYLFDDDAAAAFNQHLPLTLWGRAATTDSLPSNLRANIAQAGWVRSVVIGSEPEEFGKILAGLKPSYAADLASFANLSGAERSFAEVFWMLHHPELNINVRADLARLTKDQTIDSFRDNWWCGVGSGNLYDAHAPAPSVLSFVTPAQTSERENELSKLNAAGVAPAFLARQALDWASTHPNDPRNPEALALAVKSARYSCTDPQSAKYCERAFGFLHSHYPNSPWTKRTPYWF